ncbi:MAG: hypothetical protein IKN59_06780, partial [Paludibacteraceae bacterium]|nr:hypothetical protein [Paludibacteraceae bacterium]
APVIASDGYENSKNISCIADATEPTAIPSAKNSCDEVVTPTMERTTDWTGGKENCTGKIIYTYTYTDCDKSSTWSYTYNLNNTVAPTIALKDGVQATYDLGCDPTIEDITVSDFVVTDICDANASVQLSSADDVTNCVHTRVYTATYTNACDVVADPVTVTYTWTVSQAPEIGDITVPAALPAGNCKYALPDLRDATMAVTTDPCGGTPTFVSQSPAAATEYAQTSTETNITVTVTVQGTCGRTTSQDVTVVIPANDLNLTMPSDVAICNGKSTDLEATSNATTFLWSPATGLDKTDVASVKANPTTTTIYTLTVANENGCTTNGDVTVTVNPLPVLAIVPVETLCPNVGSTTVTANITTSTTPNYTYDWTSDVLSLSDKTSANTTETFNVSIPTDCGENYTINLKVTDANGCESESVSQTIEVKDETAPTLSGTWPDNITGQDNCFANADASGLLSDDDVAALYSDNCNVVTVTHEDANTLTSDCGWTITRTYTIKDFCGNSTTNTMSVSGSDQTAPALTGSWPADITDQNNCFADADKSGLKSAEDIASLYEDCGGVSVTFEDANTLTSDCGWTITRTYTIKDACGNTVTPSPTMSVSGSDQTAPVLTGIWPADVTGQNNCFSNADKSVLATETEVAALFTDNCAGEINVTYADAESLTSDCGWTIIRTYTIKDACGNTVTPNPTMSLSGKDQSAPEIASSLITSSPADVANCVFTVPDFEAAVRSASSDNCTLANNLIITQNPTANTVLTGTRDVTITVADACGNETPWTITVTVPETINANITSAESFCYNTSDGVIEGTFEGGKAPYTVSWKGAATGSQSNVSTIKIEDLPDGDYTVTVTDVNGCHVDRNATIAQLTQTITLTADSKEKVYDGEELTLHTYTGGDNLEPSDEIADVVFSDASKITNVGQEDNVIESFKIMRGSQDVTCYYNRVTKDGELKVTCQPVTVTAKSDEFEYDGAVHSNAGYDVAGLVGSDAISADVVGSIQYVDQSPVTNVLQSYTFTTGNPDNYCVTTVDGELTMKYAGCINLTITANSNSWEYDATAHSEDSYTLTIGEGSTAVTAQVGAGGDYTFDNGDVLKVDVAGAITNVTESDVDNVATVLSILNGSTDVSSAYCVTTEDGKLTVTPKSVTIKIEDSKHYDGNVLVTDYSKAIVTGLVDGDALIAGAVTTSGKDVATYTYDASSSISTLFETSKGISNYSVTYDLTQVINKRQIIFTSSDAEKPYDGSPLTKHEVIVSGENFVNGEGATFDVTGSRTDVGSDLNAFTYTFNDGTDANNYEVAKVKGTLTVTANMEPITIASASRSWTYDCTNHNYETYTVTYGGAEVTPEADGKTFILPTGDELVIQSTAAGVTYYDASYSENNTYTYTLEHANQYGVGVTTTYGT